MYFTIDESLLYEYTSQIDHNHEFEIRFGSFVNGKFSSSVSTETFQRIKRTFASTGTSNELHTFETIYSVGKGSIKEVNENYMYKETLKKYNIYDYDIRLSLARENIVHTLPKYAKRVLTRKKDRISFTLDIGVLDLTIVYENGSNLPKYEVELEVKYNNASISELIKYINLILQLCQDNYYVIGNKEKKAVIEEYRDIVSSKYFIGAQPETLQKNDLILLKDSLYSVTDKADGERMIMVINKKGFVYFVDNNLRKVFKTDLRSQLYKQCVVDGELVRYNHTICFLAFDLIAYNNKNLRGDVNYLLKQRLDRLNHIISTLPKTNYLVKMKRFMVRNVFKGSKLLQDTINQYNNDGLIFTPVNEPYPTSKKWSNLLKWKPSMMNTIDFFSIKKGGIWELYVQNSQNHIELFNVFNMDCAKVKMVTYTTSFDDTTVDTTTNEPFKTNTVIEYRWDFDQSKFVPLRTRWDKTIDPRKHGNFIKVACDIWNNIHNPLELDDIINFA